MLLINVFAEENLDIICYISMTMRYNCMYVRTTCGFQQVNNKLFGPFGFGGITRFKNVCWLACQQEDDRKLHSWQQRAKATYLFISLKEAGWEASRSSRTGLFTHSQVDVSVSCARLYVQTHAQVASAGGKRHILPVNLLTNV